MGIIKKLIVKNFKKFDDRTFEFNEDINILVGDNESGKSTILEAIDICLNLTYRNRSVATDIPISLFNNDCIKSYLEGDKSQETLPEIRIEAVLENCDPELKGTNNTEGLNSEGIFVHIYFDTDLSESYDEFVSGETEVSTIPVEFYRVDWYSFAWNRLTKHNKKIECLFVDPTRLHPTYGRARYINSIISRALDKHDRATLNLSYRQLKQQFESTESVTTINNDLDIDNSITEKNLKITTDIGATGSWESNLQLSVDDITFDQIGKGEQNQIQIKLVLYDKANDVDIVMLEEPENHLSYMNLTKLISYIEQRNAGKQVFISTHSSYVLNKLSIDKLCLLAQEYKRLHEVDEQTVKRLKRLPGYDTLRVILAAYPILVEGPSDEIVLKRLYKDKYNRLPEEDGIDIIVVHGIGFKTFLNIAKQLKQPVRVVKDNDGCHKRNIVDWAKEYEEFCFIEVFSSVEDDQNSLEPSMIAANSSTEEKLDKFAEIILSPQTFSIYLDKGSPEDRRSYLIQWFSGSGSGSKKVDSAVRLFDSSEHITYPAYLQEAINYDG